MTPGYPRPHAVLRRPPVPPLEPEPQAQPPSRSFRWRERERPDAAEDLAAWCTEAARMLHTARRLGAENEDARALKRRLVPELVGLASRYGPLEIDITPRSLVLGDETVFAADHSNAPTGERGLERELSWVLHRDGLRALRLDRGLTEAEAATFLDVLILAAPADSTHEDLVTMLWESGFTHLATKTEEADIVRVDPLTGRVVAAAHGSLPHVDDWPQVDAPGADAKRLWEDLQRGEAESVPAFRDEWARERSESFAAGVEAMAYAALLGDARPEVSE